MRQSFLGALPAVWLTAAAAAAQLPAAQPPADPPTPRVLTEGVRVELVASDPDIVTPVGMAFDRGGRLLVIESHTHGRQQDYAGPRHDRVRVMTDTDGDGRLDAWSTFAEGYTHALNLAVHPSAGDIYLVCRNEVHVLRDTDNDGQADEDEVIVRVETDVNYPHNGLGGIAFANDETLYLGFGENFGAAYTITGSDGGSLGGRGGVGVVLQCDARGGGLRRYARGFWNPFGLACVGAGGSQLFAVDNDPDASPPCRLLHVLPAGDYGHRWEYGRAGLHPLQAWDGELPGTIGMMAGTGEAPCAVLSHRGRLWVTSWGEHRIERYRLRSERGSYTASREVVVQGNADFRPTGMTRAPDGSLYFADWVSRSYPVHGAGRIWRVSFETPAVDRELTATLLKQAKASADEQRSLDQLAEEVNDNDERLSDWLGRCREQLRDDLSARQRHITNLPGTLATDSKILSANTLDDYGWYGDLVDSLPVLEAGRWWAINHPDEPPPRKLLRLALRDSNASSRLYAVRWIADEHLTDLRDDVAKLLEAPIPSERYYLAVLAAVDWLSGDRKPRDKGVADELLLAELKNASRPAATRAIALRLLSPNLRRLSIEWLQELADSEDAGLRAEAVRTLAAQRNPRRVHLLAKIARDGRRGDRLRAEAVVGLGAFAEQRRELLTTLAATGPEQTAAEARRVLRLASPVEQPSEEKPAAEETDAWLALLDAAPGDAESGRRLFHGALGSRCSRCHQHSGRGGWIGPELTFTGAKLSRRRLLESILRPGAEVAPRYQAWVLETDEGRVYTGLRLPKGGDDGVERYADAEGREFLLKSSQIELRSPSKASIMPSGLEKLVSVQDLRDLIAFLQNGTPGDGPAGGGGP